MTHIINTIAVAFPLVFRLDATMLAVLGVITRLRPRIVVATVLVERHTFVIAIIVALFVCKLACTRSVTQKK